MSRKRRLSPRRPRGPRRDQDWFQTAVALHRDGILAEAEKAYRRVLRAEPRRAEALHLLGVILHRRGESAAGAKLIRQALDVRPDYSAAVNDLGNVLHEMGQLEEAASCFRKRAKLNPGDATAFNNLGVVLKDQNKLAEAVASYERAIELEPDNPGTHCNLGNVLKRLCNWNEAADAYRRAIALDRGLVDAWRNLAVVLRSAGRLDESREAFQQWLNQDPDNPIARHLLAACSAAEVPDRASDDYVRRVFDEYAETFNQALGELDYRGPEVVDGAVREVFDGEDASKDVLDAGCGTGLCGPCLRPYARTLVGVDLSAKMLARARELDLYDELIEAELTSFMQAGGREFDLICAADTFNYFGDLESVFAAAHRTLRDDGVLIFTLETETDEGELADFRLHANGRYGHNVDYVKRTLVARGFSLMGARFVALRKEASKPVVALVVQAKKSRSPVPPA